MDRCGPIRTGGFHRRRRLAQVYAEKFLDDAKESFGHAQLVGDKIVSLGGVPVATRNEIKQSRDLQEVLQFSLAFESKAVEMYSKAIDMAEGNKSLTIFLEDILKEEQDGVDEYTKLLRESSGTAAAANSSAQNRLEDGVSRRFSFARTCSGKPNLA